MTVATPKILQRKDFDILSIYLRDDGLVNIDIKSDEEITVSHVKLIVHALQEMGGGKIFPLLITVGERTLPSEEARRYIALAESDPYASAEAYVISSLSQKLVGNFYLRFNKPARPTRIFTNTNEAIEWLKTFQ